MNVLCSRRGLLLVLKASVTRSAGCVHGFTSRKTVQKCRGASFRAFSSTPTVSGGVSKVPGAGAKDSWSDETLQLDPGGGVSEVSQGDVLQVVSDAAHTGQDLASLGLGALYTPVGLAQILLDSLHASTGLPWWGTVAIATVVMRILLFPLSVKFAKNATKMAKIQPELAEIMKKVQHYTKIGATELVQKEQMKVADLYKAHNCSPLTMMALPFMQLPFFMSFFVGLRKMALAPVEEMKSGGMLWFGDLTIPDPTYSLPVIACGLFVMNIQVCCAVASPSDIGRQYLQVYVVRAVSRSFLHPICAKPKKFLSISYPFLCVIFSMANL